MKSKKLLSMSAIIASVPFAVSMMLFLYNVKYIKYCFLFGDIVKEMRYSYAILGWTFDSEIEEMYKEFANRGDFSFITLCIAIAILLSFFVVFLVSLKMKSIEIMQEQTALLRGNTNAESGEQSNICVRCGVSIPLNSSFCSRCGSSLEGTTGIKKPKEKNPFSSPLIIFMAMQVIGLICSFFSGTIGSIMILTSVIAIPLCFIFGILTIVKAKNIDGKKGLALGIVAVALYGFIIFMVLAIGAVSLLIVNL